MKVAYIAGPYRADTIYGIIENIRHAEKYALKYWRLGYAVICPHKNTALLDGALPDSVWLNGDLELLRRCDVIVMIPGWERSAGARAELREAARRGLKQIYEKGTMTDYLIQYECCECGNVEYFDIDSLPGGDEHCEYCSKCSGKLIGPNNHDKKKGEA